MTYERVEQFIDILWFFSFFMVNISDKTHVPTCEHLTDFC